MNDWLVFRNQRRVDIKSAMVVLGIATILFYFGDIQGHFSSYTNSFIAGFMAANLAFIVNLTLGTLRIQKRLGLPRQGEQIPFGNLSNH